MAVRDIPASASDCRESGKLKWRKIVLLSLGVLVALLARWGYQVITEQMPPAPIHVAPSVASDAGHEGSLRREAWQRVRPNLKEADRGTQNLAIELTKKIESFFDDRQEHSEAFAQAALGWPSKWQLLHGREAHRKFLTEQFSKYIFSQDEMVKLLGEVAVEYELGLKEIDNNLLVSIRADIDDIHRSAVPAFSNEQLLSEDFDRIFATVASDVGKDFGVSIGKGTATFVTADVIANVIVKSLAAVAKRLGLSAAILGTGATSSAATFGAGIVVAVAVDYMLDWLIGWFYDPVGNISTKVKASLNEVKTSIISGVPEAWAIRNRLAEMAEHDPDAEVRVRALQVVGKIERGGSLGLKHSLNRVAEVYRLARERTLRQLVLGGSHEE